MTAWHKISLSAVVLACGCATERRTLELDAQHPAVRVSEQGVLFGDRYVQPLEVPEILDDCDVPHDRTIYIALDAEVKDLRQARFLMACLAKSGYTRSMLVTKKHADSHVVTEEERAAQ